MRYFLFLSVFSFLNACSNASKDNHENAVKEIFQAEADFEKMAAEKGIAEAFGFFADTNAIIKRNHDSLINGKEAIRNFYSAEKFKSARVKWKPDFVDVSGDLGYTYGYYTWSSPDSLGNLVESRGVFHTVWKKQADGSWKYVWD